METEKQQQLGFVDVHLPGFLHAGSEQRPLGGYDFAGSEKKNGADSCPLRCVWVLRPFGDVLT